MTPATLFLTIGCAYLALIAYGVVRTRKKGLPRQVRLVAAAAQVILPPLILFAVLLTNRTTLPVGGWGILLAMLLVAGALLALCTDIIARRVLP